MLSAPINVTFGVTGNCNLRCRHCLAKETWQAEDLSTGEMLSLIDQLGAAKVLKISLFGGEPLMRTDLFELLDRFRRYPIVLSMNTNASLMTDDLCRSLVGKYGIRTYCVSLDGSREVHDRLRGRGSYDGALRGIRTILRHKGAAMLSFAVNRLNIGDIEEVTELGRSLGVSNVRFNHITHSGNAACFEKDMHVPYLLEREACDRIHALSLKYPGLVSGSYLQQYGLYAALPAAAPQRASLRVNPCGAAVSRCAIRPDGWITPCEVLWEVKAGNVRRSSFAALWKNSKVMKDFRKPFTLDLRALGECGGCEFQRMCFTGHRCNPYHYAGGIKKKELYCKKI